jgi:hypothetical protein
MADRRDRDDRSATGGDPFAGARRQHPSAGSRSWLVVDCDGCAGNGTSACADCVISHVLAGEAPVRLTLESADERAVRLLAKAGLVPDLRFESVEWHEGAPIEPQ